MHMNIKSWLYWKVKQRSSILLRGNKPNILVPDDVSGSYDNNLLNYEIKDNIQLDPNYQVTLSAPVLNYLWERLNELKPKVIFEFGSGLSTRLFIQYFKKVKNGTLISVDQEAKYLEASRQGLDMEGVNYFPMAVATQPRGYELDLARVREIVEKYGLIDFVLIDGPKGDWMARENTLPLVVDFCHKKYATWYLDDALRDSELAIVKSWKKNQSIHVEGILEGGKGLCVGSVR